MIFRYIQGKNFKDFIIMENLTTHNDIKLYEIVKSVLYRKEYNPFIKNITKKTIEYSYLFQDYIFPLQFWNDVKEKCSQFIGVYCEESDLKLIDSPFTTLYNQLKREDFDEWLHNLVIPDDISIDKEEYKYQQDAVFGAINNKICRIEIATSGGKTFITYMYCRWIIEHIKSDKKILIVVPSQLLCTQLKKDFEHYNKFNDKSKILVETIYSGSKKILDANIVCGTYQSLCKYDEEFFDDFNVFICDELHRSKAYSIRNGIYAKMKYCEYILGMTGSFPEYKSLDYLHIVSMFGSEISKISAEELIERAVANKVVINSIILEYPVDNIYSIIGDAKNFEDNYIKKYMLEKEYYHHNIERTDMIAKLINKFEDNSIIFVDTIEYCYNIFEHLKNNCPDRVINIIHGAVKNRDQILDDMREHNGKHVIIATYGTMSTGVSIKNLTNAYMIDCGKSDIRIRQSIGRLMRILDGKNESKVFDFYDNIKKSIFRNHAIARLNIYKDQKLSINTYKTSISK